MWKKEDDWFWEGNVQAKIASYLRLHGYTVEEIDTGSKTRGVDIQGISSVEKLIVEVKGYPSDKYVDGP